jgi:hypothetical protein
MTPPVATISAAIPLVLAIDPTAGPVNRDTGAE